MLQSNDATARDFSILPPHDIEAEMCLIASMMLLGEDKAAHATILGMMDREAFYQADHQIIFDAICELRSASKPVDVPIVADALKRKNLWEDVGGIEYIAAILNKVPSAAHFAHYAAIVAEKSKLRELIMLGNVILRKAYAGGNGEDADDIAMQASADCAKIATTGRANEVWHIRDVMPEIMARRGVKGSARLQPTGLVELDNAIGGLGYGMKHVVGALQGVGKSAFLKKILRGLAGAGVPVGIISIEEKRSKITANLLSGESGVLNNRIQFGTANDTDWEAMEPASQTLVGLPIHIVDSARKLSSIVAMAHLLAAKHGCRGIFIDHVHIIDGEKERGQSREQEICKISGDLKWVWRELDVIGVEACQLNRAIGRERPTSANLRDSGTLAQDADVIMLLHREDYHRRDEAGFRPDNVLEVILDKNKDGPTGKIKLYYDTQNYLIADLDENTGKPIWSNSVVMPPADLSLVGAYFDEH